MRSSSRDHHPPLCHLLLRSTVPTHQLLAVTGEKDYTWRHTLICSWKCLLHSISCDKECVRTVQLTGTCMHVFDFVGAYSWCWPTLHRFLCVFQGVVPLTLCQQQLLSIVPGGSSVSRPLIRIYKAHTSHRETPQSHTDLKPLTSAYIHLWQHITATTGKKTKNLLIRRYF